jgi:hypothetical protein
MRNPTVEQVNFVIGRLQLVRNKANKEGAFNMNNWRVYSKRYGYKCGTTHCVGGWYAIANLYRKFIKDKFNQGRVAFYDGANLMAYDLGFRNGDYLRNWAKDNPEIWDNENGYAMFNNELAYNNSGFDGLIAQWELVKQNLIKLEK